ncbi:MULTISPECIES: MscL family protein [unclassified Dysgonomonas]|uniref:MscL family protein n=1 Tax=unclassified Dysgonomonas TaxID=2630389 RepID=UPI002D1FBE9C|nr:MscL family protein [Dysgonomonas sp.]
MAIIKELRTFMTHGNLVSMAMGIIIGGGLEKIVSSLVGDIIMPPIGLIENYEICKKVHTPSI